MYIGDLHIHSRYSRATSKDCTPEHLDLWARKKGIHIVGTGDFTHPAWREELAEKLEPAEDGLYVLKDEYRIKDEVIPGEMIPRFVITGEISSRSGISILTEDRSWGLTVMTCWRSFWNCARRQSMCRLISGRRIFLCSARSRDLIQWKSALRILCRTFMPLRQGFPRIRR